MMSLPQPKAWMRSKMLYVIPLSMLALSVFATPSIIEPIESTVNQLAEQETSSAEKLATDSINKKELMIEWDLESIGKRKAAIYRIRIPRGTWIENRYKKESYIDEVGINFDMDFTPTIFDDSTIIKIDGVVYDKDNLPNGIILRLRKSSMTDHQGQSIL